MNFKSRPGEKFYAFDTFSSFFNLRENLIDKLTILLLKLTFFERTDENPPQVFSLVLGDFDLGGRVFF